LIFNEEWKVSERMLKGNNVKDKNGRSYQDFPQLEMTTHQKILAHKKKELSWGAEEPAHAARKKNLTLRKKESKRKRKTQSGSFGFQNHPLRRLSHVGQTSQSPRLGQWTAPLCLSLACKIRHFRTK
jgi:hypothetical protein